MTSTIQLRPAQSIPYHTDAVDTISLRSHHIRFRHPGYPDKHNLLFTLLAADNPEGGLHHETARIACGIIAGNRWDGHLSTSPIGTPIKLSRHGLLQHSEYYYILPPPEHELLPPSTSPSSTTTSSTPLSAYKYPVVPSFAEWEFPHERLPPIWNNIPAVPPAVQSRTTSSNLSGAIAQRDGTCRMSDHREGCDLAHICPKSEDAWFHRNGMYRYVSNPLRTGRDAINDPSNVMLLRADLHGVFDQRLLVYVPKGDDGGLVTHVLSSSAEHRSLYQNSRLHTIKNAPEMLFARFAWTVLPLIEGFLISGIDRTVLVASSPTPHFASSEECKSYTKQPSTISRNVSPKRRSRSEPEIEEEADNEDATGGQLHAKRSKVNLPCSTSSQSVEDPAFSNLTRQPTPELLPHTTESAIAPSKPRQNDGIEKLRGEFLAYERARSDPAGNWDKEQQWLRTAFNHPLSSEEIRRYLLAIGLDVLDNDEDS